MHLTNAIPFLLFLLFDLLKKSSESKKTDRNIWNIRRQERFFSFHYFSIQDNKFIILMFSLKVIKFIKEYNFPKNVEKIKDMWNIIKHFFYNKIHEFLFSYILTFHVFAIKIYGNKNSDSAIY